MNIRRYIKAVVFNCRFKRACRRANRYRRETGFHALVLLLGNKPVVKYRKVLKQEIKRKQWRCNIETLERHALYKTY